MTITETAKPPVRNTRRNRATLLVLLSGASNVGLATVWLLVRGSSVAMAKLERAGWITSEWESPDWPADSIPPPRRRFYSLTPYGRAQAMAMLGLREG